MEMNLLDRLSLPRIIITPASDDEDDEDIMRPRDSHVPVIPPLPGTPKRSFSLSSTPYASPSKRRILPLPRHQQVLDQMRIGEHRMQDVELNVTREMMPYFLRIYRYLCQAVFDAIRAERKAVAEGKRSPASCCMCEDFQLLDTPTPTEFAQICSTLCSVRIHLIRAMYKQDLDGERLPFNVAALQRIALPNCIASPVNGIGVVNMAGNIPGGPVLALPATNLSLEQVMREFDRLQGSGRLQRFERFVRLCETADVMRSTPVSTHVGGRLWWLLMTLDRFNDQNAYEVIVNIATVVDFRMAALVLRSGYADEERMVKLDQYRGGRKRYILEAKLNVSDEELSADQLVYFEIY